MKWNAVIALAAAPFLAGALTGVAAAGINEVKIAAGEKIQSENARSGASTMNEAEIKQKLEAEGYSNVQLGKRERDRIDVTAMKNGQRVELEVDPQSGAVAPEGKEKDDDDD